MNLIEAAINEDIGEPNYFSYLNLHEFEALLFSNPASFSLVASDEVVQKVQEIRDEYPTPEDINNSVLTAPSKRLIALIPNYAKIKNGTLLSKDMGIRKIMEECPHFRTWVEKIIALPEIANS